MQPLIPTQVTDVNGRVTTVHKRPDNHAGTSPALNIPAPAAPSLPSRTPLVLPQPITDAQILEFNEHYGEAFTQITYRRDSMYTFLYDLDEVTQALIKRVCDSGKVQPQTVVRFLTRYREEREGTVGRLMGANRDGAARLGQLQAALLVAEKMGHQSPAAAAERGSMYALIIERGIKGYCFSPKKSERVPLAHVRTEEELASLTAVITYLIDAQRRMDYLQYKSTTMEDAYGASADVFYMTNRTLDAFLRKNPDETDRVIRYVSERGIGTTAQETKNLTTHLHETKDFGLLSDGWV